MASLLNGTGAYLQTPEQSSSISSTATLSLWLKCEKATPSSTARSGFCSLGLDNHNENSHYPYTNGMGYISVFRNSGARVNAINLGSTNRVDWHHVAVTSEPGTNGWKFYTGGQLRQQTTGHSTISFRSGNWRFGRSGSTGQYFFEGAIADLAIWNVALTSGEIGALASGCSTTLLTNRISNLVVCQDLIRPLNRPGIGSLVSAGGTPTVERHAPIRFHPGIHTQLARSFPWILPFQVAARQFERAGSTTGQTSIAGAEAGTTILAGEVAS